MKIINIINNNHKVLKYELACVSEWPSIRVTVFNVTKSIKERKYSGQSCVKMLCNVRDL